MKEAGLYCDTCQRQTMHRQQGINHVLHFLITFFTCGLWVIPWIAMGDTASKKPWLCTQCGTGAMPPRPAVSPMPAATDRVSGKVVVGIGGGLLLLFVVVMVYSYFSK